MSPNKKGVVRCVHLQQLTEMASKSLTAVASVISVVKDKTVIALRCHTRGCERVTYPILVIAIMCVGITFLAVAAILPAWVEVRSTAVESS